MIEGTNGMALVPEDQVKQLLIQIKALELELAQRTEISSNSTRHAQSWEDKYREMSSKYQEEHELKLAITRDMTRQYKMMQEELIQKLSNKERTIQGLVDNTQNMKIRHEADLEKKENDLRCINTTNEQLRDELHELHQNFSIMLSNTLENLLQRINPQRFLKDQPENDALSERMRKMYLDSEF